MANNLEIIENKNNQYEILKSKSGMIGGGAYGQVFKCRKCNSNEWNLYVKIIEKRIPKLIKNELNISQLLQQIDCVNLLKPTDCIEQTQKIYIVMEICDYDLAKEFEILQNHKQWYKEEDILDMIQQILNGLFVLNSINIIHRDIKPENILVKKVGNEKIYKISDFGISKISEDIQAYQHQTQAGTRIYWSPQIFNGQYSAKCDVFSLGILFHQVMRKVHPQQQEGQYLFQNELHNFYKNLKIEKFKCNFSEYKRYGKLFEQLLCSMIVYQEDERKNPKELIDLIIMHDVKIILQIIYNKNQVFDLMLQKASQQGLLITVDCKIIEYNILLFQLEQLKIGLALLNGIINDIPKSLILFKNFDFISIIETLQLLKKDSSFQQQRLDIERNYHLIQQRINQTFDDIQLKLFGKQQEFILSDHFNKLQQIQIQRNIKEQINELTLLKSLLKNNQAMNLREFVEQIINQEERFSIINYLYIDPNEIRPNFN